MLNSYLGLFFFYVYNHDFSEEFCKVAKTISDLLHYSAFCHLSSRAFFNWQCSSSFIFPSSEIYTSCILSYWACLYTSTMVMLNDCLKDERGEPDEPARPILNPLKTILVYLVLVCVCMLAQHFKLVQSLSTKSHREEKIRNGASRNESTFTCFTVIPWQKHKAHALPANFCIIMFLYDLLTSVTFHF